MRRRFSIEIGRLKGDIKRYIGECAKRACVEFRRTACINGTVICLHRSKAAIREYRAKIKADLSLKKTMNASLVSNHGNACLKFRLRPSSRIIRSLCTSRSTSHYTVFVYSSVNLERDRDNHLAVKLFDRTVKYAIPNWRSSIPYAWKIAEFFYRHIFAVNAVIRVEIFILSNIFK